MTVWPEGYGRRVLAEVDSTNAEAARIADGLSAPEWILGLRQTQGRGRRGRAWQDPDGNFAATLVHPSAGDPARAALRSFVAALALDAALTKATGRPELFALKWPNDVLLTGGKLAGILLESAGPAGAARYLAIGIGVNLMTAPPAGQLDEGALRPVSLAGETGIGLDPESFLDLLAPAYAELEAQFVQYGFDPIRTAWLARAARLGQTITARTGKHQLTGRFDTIDAEGQLVLDTPAGRRHLPAAEIFF